MTTLIGRECWFDNGTMKHGKIVAQKTYNESVYDILCDNGKIDFSHVGSLFLNIDDAIECCERNADLWKYQAKTLEEEKAEREATVNASS